MGKLKEFWSKVDVSVEPLNGLEFGIRHVNGEDLEGWADEDDNQEYSFGILLSFAFLTFLFTVKK